MGQNKNDRGSGCIFQTGSTILDKINGTSGPPLPHFNDAKMAHFLLLPAFIIALGGRGLIVPFYSVQDCRYLLRVLSKFFDEQPLPFYMPPPRSVGGGGAELLPGWLFQGYTCTPECFHVVGRGALKSRVSHLFSEN